MPFNDILEERCPAAVLSFDKPGALERARLRENRSSRTERAVGATRRSFWRHFGPTFDPPRRARRKIQFLMSRARESITSPPGRSFARSCTARGEADVAKYAGL